MVAVDTSSLTTRTKARYRAPAGGAVISAFGVSPPLGSGVSKKYWDSPPTVSPKPKMSPRSLMAAASAERYPSGVRSKAPESALHLKRCRRLYPAGWHDPTTLAAEFIPTAWLGKLTITVAIPFLNTVAIA
jgi:hypothetical protein